jgi:hypothetical protein
MTCDIAGCFRFFTLIQSGDRPARYGRSRRFETKPSKPMLLRAGGNPGSARREARLERNFGHAG